MSSPIDRSQDQSRFSAPARLLVARRDEIMARWARRFRSLSGAMSSVAQPILINTLPLFLDNLAEALSPDFPRRTAGEGTNVAQEHGGERARLTHYGIEQLITEYQLLQRTVIEVLSEAHTLTASEYDVISVSFDEAIRASVTAFALVQAHIREQFIAALTHDLRNPLGSAMMAVELIKMRPDDAEDVMSLATTIGNNLKRMESMTRDILDVTIARSGGRIFLELGRYDMLEIVKDVVEQATLAHGDRFVIKGESTSGVWGRDGLQRALENLIANAVKYGTPGSVITITVSSANGRVFVAVHNDGPPIPIDEQEGIFQVFRRAEKTRSAAKSWGMGLALVRGVAESHGGSVGLDSGAERGTTFTIDIPQDSTPFQDSPVM